MGMCETDDDSVTSTDGTSLVHLGRTATPPLHMDLAGNEIPVIGKKALPKISPPENAITDMGKTRFPPYSASGPRRAMNKIGRPRKGSGPACPDRGPTPSRESTREPARE